MLLEGTVVAGLRGARVLIVEDEFVLALLLEETLTRFGAQVVEVADTLAAARQAAARADIDAAVLDVYLHGQASFPAAEALALRGIPLVFTSAYAGDALPPLLANAPLVAKPYRAERVAVTLASTLGLRAVA